MDRPETMEKNAINGLKNDMFHLPERDKIDLHMIRSRQMKSIQELMEDKHELEAEFYKQLKNKRMKIEQR